MFSETRRLSSPSGALLAYHYEEALAPARATVVICHGLIEHSRRYQSFAKSLSANGFNVYAHDHRGHGESCSTHAPLGIFALSGGPDKVIQDVLAMREVARSEHPRLPLILFGHSMGGLIALNAAIAYPQAMAGLAIWNSNFNTGREGKAAKFVLALERMLKGSDVPSSILPRATFGAWGKSIEDRSTEFDWLSRDPDVVARYAADPLCRFDASISMWQDVLELAQRPMRKGALSPLNKLMPIHLVGGGQDPATRNAADVRWLAKRLRHEDFRNVTMRIYEEMRHETVNEIGREQAIDNFCDWINGVARKASHS
ncbi:alpha/beta hydrolase [Ciceribacter sp. L1K23]|uniref:alpha/beta hydrolase n=1 Tax=Ciceribacter sp. L1K23 TaxID=2820276 RepID=UPI001B83A7D1|nr:alpha/beta hydrolase [Ciceribacter sp. L1K23]MBR0555060.1 alpha/beta hydrolase [Ciceribacter sp. L1K23]